MKFHSSGLQTAWNEYQAQMNSPEIVAKAKEELAKAQKAYWKSFKFIVPVCMSLVGLMTIWAMKQAFGSDPNLLSWVIAIGMPVFLGALMYPRDYKRDV